VFSHRQQTTIDQYLAEYAEADGLGITMNRQFAQVLVIPAYSERPATLSRLWAEMPADVLIILVINAPAYDPKTIALLAHFETDCTLSAPHARWRASLQKHKAGLLVINRCHPGAYIPERQGVGFTQPMPMRVCPKITLPKPNPVTLPAGFTPIGTGYPRRSISKPRCACTN
jgi:hypothetical protein